MIDKEWCFETLALHPPTVISHLRNSNSHIGVVLLPVGDQSHHLLVILSLMVHQVQ